MTRGHLHSKTKKELQVMARQIGIPKWRSMTKKELVHHLWGKINHDAFSTISQPFSREIQDLEEQKVEAAKYDVRKSQEGPLAQFPQELPSAYGDDRIVLMVRDPHWIFAYWEITPQRLQEVLAYLGPGLAEARKALRVYQVDGRDDNGQKAQRIFDIVITPEADNWYIKVPDADRSYYVEIGLLSGEDHFTALARSSVVTTPRSGMSDVLDEAWMSRQVDYEKMYALSGGLRLGESSLELREKLERLLQEEMASGAVGSWGMWSGYLGRRGRRFRFQLNTELVVYGSTEPDAEVKVGDKRISLKADGTFSFRLALPDGRQSIPVTSKSADGLEERTVIPSVEKSTRVLKPTIRKDPKRNSQGG